MTKDMQIPGIKNNIHKKEHDSITTAKQGKNLFYANVFWFIIYSITLSTCLVMANRHPDIKLHSFFPISGSESDYVLSNLPLIKRFNINIVGSVIWACGAVSVLLTYLQFHNDFKEGL